MVTTGSLTFTSTPPAPAAFAQLRADCGWGLLPVDVARRAISGGLINITCHDGDILIGCGRVVGDGVIYFYLQDIIVHPSYQGRGIGRQIVERLVMESKQMIPSEGTIGLLAVHGKEAFYEQIGFTSRPTSTVGAGMSMHVTKQQP